MKKTVIGIIAITVAMLATPAIAQSPADGAWQVRARAVHIDPADHSAPLAGTGAADRIGVESRTIPEIDIGYFFTPHLAAELVLTYPQKHEVYLDGQSIGSFRHLPPTLLAQYHFTPGKTVSPYVGLGVNWTTFSKNRLLDGQGSLEHDSIGLAAQAGIDFHLAPRWSLNVDVKKLRLRSDLLVGGTRASEVKVDPVLFGIGIGYRF